MMRSLESKRQKKLMTLHNFDDCEGLFNSFFNREQGTLFNTIISGGRQADRTAVVFSAIRMARGKSGSLPVIILHQNNPLLNKKFCSDGRQVTLPNGERHKLSFLGGLNDTELINLLYNVAHNRYNCTLKLNSLLRAGIELLRLDGKRVTLSRLCQLRWRELKAYLDEVAGKGAMEVDTLMRYAAQIGAGEEEIETATMLFSELNMEVDCGEKEEDEGLGLEQIIDAGGCVCINLQSNMQNTKNELLFQLFKLMLQKEKKFLLVLDSISFGEQGSLARRMLRDAGSSFAWVVSGSNIIGVLSEDFPRISGNINAVVFRHSSGEIAKAWAAYFGERDEVQKSLTRTEGRDKQHLLSGQSSWSEQSTVQRRFAVLPEAIQTLEDGEALIRSGSREMKPWYVNVKNHFGEKSQKQLR